MTTGAVTSVRARRTTTLLTTGVLSMALTACGVSLDPQTYRERSTHDASNATIGDLALRNVGIEPPESGAAELALGKDALVTMAVVSVSDEADTLTSVSTAAASSAELVDGSGHAVPTVAVPALGSIAENDFGVVLRGLTKPLRPGMHVDVTFAFAKNGRATFAVPVRLYSEPVPRESYEPKHVEE
jgi:copper(I)-binding protein